LSKTNSTIDINRNQAFTFMPCTLSGEVLIPPSKSYLHRYIIAAALSRQTITLTDVTSLADDVLVTLQSLTFLRADYCFNQQESTLTIKPQTTQANHPSSHKLNMQESGTSLRLLLPLLIHFLGEVTILGENQLPTRPLTPYIQVFDAVEFLTPTHKFLPLYAKGKITAKEYVLSGAISSQFISGLLFTLPLLTADSSISLTTPLASLPYVKMSLAVLETFQIQIEHNADYTQFQIKGNQSFVARNPQIQIESDYSARAFWEVAKAIKHHDLIITPPAAKSLQGDSAIIELIQHNIRDIDLTHIPDLAPILAVYLTQTGGGTLLHTERLVHKESNRLLAIQAFLDRAGISYKQIDNTLHIDAGTIKENRYFTFYDHRITMALVIASTIATGAFQLNELCSINKSYPHFIHDYQALGGKLYE